MYSVKGIVHSKTKNYINMQLTFFRGTPKEDFEKSSSSIFPYKKSISKL